MYTDIDYRLNTKNKDIKISIDAEAINNSIRNILLTEKYSVPGNPEFGSNLNKTLFEQMDGVTFALMEQIIITELGRWEPRIIVDDINISYDRNYQQVLIRINYTIIVTNDVRVANIKLNRR